MRRVSGLIVCVFLMAFVPTFAQKHFLSSLNADKNFPIYTTYAAAKERSSYLIDKAYHFQYYIDSLGANFVNERAGDWGISFKMDGKIVSKTAEMYRPPIIKASFPDIVQYEFYPFSGVKVEAIFLVFRSNIAVFDAKVFNETGRAIDLELFPYFKNENTSFHSLVTKEKKLQFEFQHEEQPDNWMKNHQIPFQDSLKNLIWFSSKMDTVLTFASEKGEAPLKYINSKNFVAPKIALTGEVFNQNNQKVKKPSESCGFQLFVNGNLSKLLCENAFSANISPNGLVDNSQFLVDVSKLNENAQSFSLLVYDRKTKKGNIVEKNQIDAQLNSISLNQMLLKQPQSVKLSREEGIFYLTWMIEPNVKYDIYRRKIPSLVYERVVSDDIYGFYKDLWDERNNYGFVVIAKDEKGNKSPHSEELLTQMLKENKEVSNSYPSFNEFLLDETKPVLHYDLAKMIAFKKQVHLEPEEAFGLKTFRIVYAASQKKPPIDWDEIYTINAFESDYYIKENEWKYNTIDYQTQIDFDKRPLYWSAINMLNQQFLPAEGNLAYNYYVFSREPIWGWGHGGQVFHESLVVPFLANYDAQTAMDSQRNFAQKQEANGYINYRTGPYLDEQIVTNGEKTSSAPFYAWINWEIYKKKPNKDFLETQYESSKKLYQFFIKNRDKDNDGLCEWGGDGVLESLRDGEVAIWDKVAAPNELEALDLNCMLVNEAKSLEAMATTLGLNEEAKNWKLDYERRSQLINQLFWDEETGFYYHVKKYNHQFTYKNANDLKRMEIIGFLPLWAGVASTQQAARLVQQLSNPNTFGRRNGVPSLSAKDDYFNDKGYWNGPVWVQWNYLIVRGLLNYGYRSQAREINNKVANNMSEVLRKQHTLYELYSPDEAWGGHHQTYIWAAIINEMMLWVNHLE